MVKYKSRVKSGLKPLQETPKNKDMASKVLDNKKPRTKPIQAALSSALNKSGVAPIVKRVAPIVKAAVQRRFGAALPVGGKLPASLEPLSDRTIDQLSPHVFVHMLGSMDMPTFHMLQGIAANYLGMEHPLRLITKQALGGDFTFPKRLSKIAMRDVMKAQSPQQLSHALHSEWIDMMQDKLSQEEVGGGLFSSLKTLVKKGVSGGKKALGALASGAAQAVRFVSAGAMGAQMVGKSVSNALMQGLEVANALSPVIQQVFPQTEGILKAGLGHAEAAKELLDRGIDISGQVERAVAPAIDVLGPLDAPIAFPFNEPVGSGLDNVDASALNKSGEDGPEDTGPRFVS